jgi:hypothetical protein
LTTGEALAPARSIVGPEMPDALLHQGLMAWAALVGTVSFELFGITAARRPRGVLRRVRPAVGGAARHHPG